MITPWVQMVVLVAMTHGFRALARWVGPGRSGLLTGLPSTTALVLVGCGLERGLDEAALAAEICLISLVASAALPLSYARAAAKGQRSSKAARAAVSGYAAVASGLWCLPTLGAAGSVALAAVGVATACRLAKSIRPREEPGREQRRPFSAAGLFACRTAVPAGYCLMIRLLRALAGPAFAGRFITFPGGSLAVLVTTHLEAGPATACRMATAMPTGGLGMLAFLAAFRYACPSLGLGWGTAAGFAAALTMLAVVAALSGRAEKLATPRPRRRSVRPRADRAHAHGHRSTGRAGSSRRNSRTRSDGQAREFVSRRRQSRRGFLPRVETLTG